MLVCKDADSLCDANKPQNDTDDSDEAQESK